VTPESLAKLEEYLRENTETDPPEGYTLQRFDVDSDGDRFLPYFAAGWGGQRDKERLGPSWWATIDLATGLNALLTLL
jgi:hypothetical protein